MRGIIKGFWRFKSEAREFGYREAFSLLGQDVARAIDFHFAVHARGGEVATFVRLPYTPLSAWAEWREANGGISIERRPGSREVWLGRLNLILCTEPTRRTKPTRRTGGVL